MFAFAGIAWAAKPEFIITTSDAIGGHTVKYLVQIDDNSDFTSTILDYTSSLDSPKQRMFTTGQAVGDGYYSTGSEGQGIAAGTYYWRVKAIDSTGTESNWSDSRTLVINATGTITDIDPPGIPTRFVITATDKQAKLTWKNPSDTDFAEIKILRQLGGATGNTNDIIVTETNSNTATQAVVTDLINDTDYTFWLTALDTSGNESSPTSKLTAKPVATGETVVEDVVPPISVTTELNEVPNEVSNEVPKVEGSIQASESLVTASPVNETASVGSLAIALAVIIATAAGIVLSSAGNATANLISLGAQGISELAGLVSPPTPPVATGDLAMGRVVDVFSKGLKDSIVQLVATVGGRVIKTVRTGATGSYLIPIAQAGSYQIKTVKDGYSPGISKVFKADGDKVPSLPRVVMVKLKTAVYFGPVIIMLLRLFTFIGRFRVPLLATGTVMAIYNAVTIGGALNSGLLASYAILDVWQVAQFFKPSFGGRIIEEGSRLGVPRAIVRAYQVGEKGKHLRSTLISDNKGRFMLSLNPGQWEVSVVVPGRSDELVKSLSVTEQKLNIPLSFAINKSSVFLPVTGSARYA